jgi:hypothetical protein
MASVICAPPRPTVKAVAFLRAYNRMAWDVSG